MSSKNQTTPDTSDREIVSRRVIAAPRQRVFEAFSDPRQLAQWWGPKGFTTTIQTFDPRPDGAWRFVMHGPDGTAYPNEKRFVEITEPALIVFDHLEHLHRFRMTMILGDEMGKTDLTWRMQFESAEQLAAARSFIAVANEENFDRLATFLARPA